jgi:hypothetical protein
MLNPEYRESTTTSQPTLVIERFLREPGHIWRQIYQQYQMNRLLHQMLISSTVAFACYGLIIGARHSVWQALASAVKLPVLFLLTLAICLPTLYLFNLLFNGRMSARQALALVLAALTVTSALTLAFAPITLFFMITAPSYPFFVLLNVVVLALTGGIGLALMVSGTRTINRLAQAEAARTGRLNATPQQTTTAPPFINLSLLRVWLLLYGFVGTQLAWTLSPFFGEPGREFLIFRSTEGNFYTEVARMLMELLLLR